tara:strand:+ start:228 stop:473 length:246 start_codon:yes stop_codon:yes gene_type:complete
MGFGDRRSSIIEALQISYRPLLLFGKVPRNQSKVLESGASEGCSTTGPGEAGESKIFVSGLGGPNIGNQRLGNFAVTGCDG